MGKNDLEKKLDFFENVFNEFLILLHQCLLPI